MALKIDVFTKDLDLTDKIHDYAVKKVAKLERFLNEIDDCRVDLSYVKTARNANERFISQITIRGKGFILRAEERASTVFAAIDTSVDKMTRQIERFKGKRWNHRAEVAAIQPSELPPEEAEEEEEKPAIVRRKSFVLVPMDEEEALEEMQLLGHEEFFVFFNSKTNKINVLYKRRDGTYGLIDPILG